MIRVPLAVTLESRDGTVGKDAKVVNGILETRGDQLVVRKRPGVQSLGSPGGGTGKGQLAYSWNGCIVIIADVLYHGSSLSNMSAVSISPTVANQRFDAQEVANTAATQLLFVKNKTQAWTFDKSFTKSSVSLPSSMGAATYPVLSLTRSVNTATATFASDPGFNTGDSVTVAGAGQAAYNGTFTITAVTAGVPAYNIPLTITRSGTTATATSSSAHGLSNGSYTLSGATQSEYNGTFTITVTSTTQFTFTVTVTAESPASPATGSPSVSSWQESVSFFSRNGTTLTVNLYHASTLANGDSVDVSGLDATWTGSRTVSNVTGTSFQVTVPNSGASNGSGGYIARTFGTSISSITRAAGSSTATVTTVAPHNLATYDLLTFTGAAQSGYNVSSSVIVTSATTFTYSCNFIAESPASPATGSPVVTVPAVNPSISYTVAGSPTTPATGTITAQGTGGMVPGIAYINGYFVIMDSSGKMWHSAVDDPTTWPSLNFLVAQNENGGGKAIAKSNNYLIAFKEWSTEFFQNDPAQSIGFAFAPVQGGFTQVGCASGDSVATCDGNLMWLSQVRQRGRSVHRMMGLQQQKVSTPDVERILNADPLTTVYGFGLKVDGHPLYVLTLVASNITLVYDLSTQSWTEWKTSEFTTSVNVSSITLSGTTATVTTNSAHGLADGDPVTISGATPAAYNGLFQCQVVSSTVFTIQVTGTTQSNPTGSITSTAWVPGYFAYSRYTDYSGQDILLHATEGTFWRMQSTYALDNVNWPIDFFMRTTRLDGGGLQFKRCSAIRLVGTEVNDIAMVRYSDDDSQTFTSYRMVDLSAQRPSIRRCGAFRRRSIEIRHIGNTTPVFTALELDIQ